MIRKYFLDRCFDLYCSFFCDESFVSLKVLNYVIYSLFILNIGIKVHSVRVEVHPKIMEENWADRDDDDYGIINLML